MNPLDIIQAQLDVINNACRKIEVEAEKLPKVENLDEHGERLDSSIELHSNED